MKKLKFEILVLGMGNSLMADDGVGIYVVEALQRKKWNSKIKFLEVGTSLFYYLEEVSSCRQLIVVDAVQAQGNPANVYRLTLDDLVSFPDGWRDPHGFSLLNLVELSKSMTGLPVGVTIYGVEPQNLSWAQGLSPEVEKVVPKVVQAITKEIENLLS